MKKLLIVLIIGLAFVSCKKDTFSKKVLFIEEFNDNSKGWHTNPSEDILTSPYNCVRIEDGLLKMYFERSLSFSDCGGGWVEAELLAPELNQNFNYEKLGVKVVLKDSWFQDLYQMNTDNTFFALLTYYFTFEVGPYRFTSSIPIFNAFGEPFDLENGKEIGNEFVFIGERNQAIGLSVNRKFIDKSEVFGQSLYYCFSDPQFSDFSIIFELGYAFELMPLEIEMMIESIEIFTWEGEFCIDKI